MFKTLYFCLFLLLSAAVGMSLFLLDNENKRLANEQKSRLLEQSQLAISHIDAYLSPLIFIENTRKVSAFSDENSAESQNPTPTPNGLSEFAKLYFEISPEGEISSPHPSPKTIDELKRTISISTLTKDFLASTAKAHPIPALTPPKNENSKPPQNIPSAVKNPTDKKGILPPEKNSVKTASDLHDNSKPQRSNPKPTTALNAPTIESAIKPPSRNQKADNLANPLAPSAGPSFANSNSAKKEIPNSITSPSKPTNSQLTETPSVPSNTIADSDLLPASEAISFQPISVTSFEAKWQSNNLFFLRKVQFENKTWIQGIWIDWNLLHKKLLSLVKKSLPEANLIPKQAPSLDLPSSANSKFTINSILTQLEPGNLTSCSATAWRNLAIPLTLSWGFILLAFIGIIFLLISIKHLNERRATFVSAVTHELRTPLTTFNLYTQMLKSQLIPTEKIPVYYETLQTEATRLTRLIDNVLTFSKLEKQTIAPAKDIVSLEELSSYLYSQISPRLLSAGMDCQIELSEEIHHITLTTNLTSLEQILSNLTDNSIKYGQNPDPESNIIKIQFRISNKKLLISFRDFGQGIDPAFCAKKLFQPFTRSAENAAGKKPGVGLGLSLSQRLARNLNGNLILKHSDPSGTEFVLELPIKPAHQ